MTPETREDMKRIRVLLEMQIKDFPLAELGLATLTLENATFDPSGSFTFKLAGTVIGGLSKEAAVYESLRKYGLPDLPPLGTEFALGAARYKIIGAKNRSNKIVCEMLSPVRHGPHYLLTHDAVLRAKEVPK